MIALIKKQPALYVWLLCLFLVVVVFNYWLQYQQYHQLLQHTQIAFADIILWHSVLPRIAMAVLVGGTLGVATILLQQVTNNILASDSTLAVNGGAQFVLLLVAIFFPSFLELFNGALWAMIGALIALGLILVLSVRRQIMTVRMMLLGMVLNLFFGAIATVLMLYYPEESKAVIQWGAGSLIQDSWHDVLLLLSANIAAGIILVFMMRPLQIMELDDTQAKSLGVSVSTIRGLGLILVSFLVAMVVSLVGMIGFIGLAAAVVVRLCKLPSLSKRIVATYVLSGLLLLLIDTLLQFAQTWTSIYLPAGVATAFLGAPLLLYIIFRSYPQHQVHREVVIAVEQSGRQQTNFMLACLFGMFILLIAGNVFVKHTASGYVLEDLNNNLLPFILPRILTALSGGVILSIGGLILQRITNNPLASPELLGVNSGAAIFILCTLLFTSLSTQYLWIMGMLGALCTLCFILVINYKNQLQPDKLLISGIAVAALMEALVRLFLTNGDPRAQFLLVWLSGSTYYSSSYAALGALAVAIVAFIFTLTMSRVISLFAFTSPIAQSLGLNVFRSRILMLVVSAILSGVFTLIMGPLSFIGLLAPHLAKVLGLVTVKIQLMGAILIGANVMLLADWLGRNVLFPYEVPTSLIATGIGACCFLLLARKI